MDGKMRPVYPPQLHWGGITMMTRHEIIKDFSFFPGRYQNILASIKWLILQAPFSNERKFYFFTTTCEFHLFLKVQWTNCQHCSIYGSVSNKWQAITWTDDDKPVHWGIYSAGWNFLSIKAPIEQEDGYIYLSFSNGRQHVSFQFENRLPVPKHQNKQQQTMGS